MVVKDALNLLFEPGNVVESLFSEKKGSQDGVGKRVKVYFMKNFSIS